MSDSTWPDKRYDLIWITCDASGPDVAAVMDSVRLWVRRVKDMGSRIVIFGVGGMNFKHTAVKEITDSGLLHLSKHRV